MRKEIYMQNANDYLCPENYSFEFGTHNSKSIIWISFPYSKNLIPPLKEIKAKWSQSNKKWYVSDTHYYRNLFNLGEKLTAEDSLSKISEINLAELQKFQNILTLKAFSFNTKRTYSYEFSQLLYLLGNVPVHTLTPDRLQSYFLYCIRELHLSENQVHSRMNAIKFYFEKVLHKEKMFFDIPRPKKPQLLPKTLNSEEVKKLFQVTENPKHRIILQLCYGMGLRVSEIAKLKIEDIDSQNLRVHIKNAKGKKDRIVVLPETILEEMRIYYKKYKPQNYLFEGQFGSHISTRTIQIIFRNAMSKAGISKTVGVHGLRHSYATHLLEYGTDIRLIKELLGHNNIKTTEIYTHITDIKKSKIKSPLDLI